MSNTKTVMSQAANTLVKPLEVEDVFSTYLYTGTGSTQTITNGIDLDGEGGLVWFKSRPQGNHNLMDTERGNTKYIRSNTTDAEGTNTNYITSFNSNGFTLGTSGTLNSTQDYASWTFRKAPKFFDVVTYTGTGSVQTIAHNLGSVPGCIIVKLYSGSGEPWEVYHRGVDSSAPEDYRLTLNTSFERSDSSTRWNDTAPTSTEFTVGTESSVNGSGATYVAYLFAHNDGDGGFNGGDIIKCGSYTGNGSTDGPEIDLGFEPQWLLIKGATQGGDNWFIVDSMRGLNVSGTSKHLYADDSAQEYSTDAIEPTSTGFKIVQSYGAWNTNNVTYIYMAIRRGTAVPESGTEVFHTQLQSNGDTYSVGFPNDLLLLNKTGGSSANTYVGSRLTGDDKYLVTSSTAAEGTSSGLWSFDLQDSFDQGASTASPWVGYHWKRAPGYFDVVAYTGNGTAGRTVSHNLGVAPEMMWVKRRNANSNWSVYHSAIGNDKYIVLNTTNTPVTSSTFWNNTDPTASSYTVGTANGTNNTNDTYIAYLFASLPGISQVGSYTGNGSSQTIDCGFTSGARFVIVRDTTGGNWFVFDTDRGLTSSSSEALRLNLTSAEVSLSDAISPNSSGFIVEASYFNNSGDTYIFYAIA